MSLTGGSPHPVMAEALVTTHDLQAINGTGREHDPLYDYNTSQYVTTLSPIKVVSHGNIG